MMRIWTGESNQQFAVPGGSSNMADSLTIRARKVYLKVDACKGTFGFNGRVGRKAKLRCRDRGNRDG